MKSIIPNTFTLAALLAGFLAIVHAAAGDLFLSAQLIMLSMVLDGIDGTLARLLNTTSKFGAELDTFVDMTSFGVAPALLAYQVALKDFGFLGMMIAAMIVFAGAMRLARFRVIDPDRGQKGFAGLPITVCAGWIALAVFIVESSLVDATLFVLSEGPFAAVIWSCVVAFTILEVSHFHYAKPTKELIFFLPSMFLVLFLFVEIHIGCISAFAMMLWGVLYAFVTPFLPKTVYFEDSEEEDAVSVRTR